MSRLFDPDICYPSDSTGPYQEFEGKIVKSEDLRDIGLAHVHVEVEGHGVMDGYWHIPDNHCDDPGSVPPVGGTARIRIYDSGGGWYPDDRIMGWSRPTKREEA